MCGDGGRVHNLSRGREKKGSKAAGSVHMHQYSGNFYYTTSTHKYLRTFLFTRKKAAQSLTPNFAANKGREI